MIRDLPYKVLQGGRNEYEGHMDVNLPTDVKQLIKEIKAINRHKATDIKTYNRGDWELQ